MAAQNTSRVGIVYADISGTTRLFHKLGTEEASYAVDRAIKRMERAIEGFSGRVVKAAAEQWIAEFDAPASAVSAAVEMQTRVNDMLAVSGIRLTVRIGVHWGGTAGTEAGRDAAIEIARRLLTMAGPSQILTCGQTAAALPPELSGMLWSCDDLLLTLPDGAEMQVYRVQWVEADEAAAMQRLETTVVLDPIPGGEASPPAEPGHFCIRAGGRSYLIDDRTPQLAIGRDKKHNDIVIRDPKASREHARIERRSDGRCVLIDTSTNGTYVLDGNAETRVRGGELLLGVKGRIAFGHSPRDQGAECLEFERLSKASVAV
ncbi:MAG TPA: FHA domain-containing protein [Rhodocyclaceae bacterium]